MNSCARGPRKPGNRLAIFPFRADRLATVHRSVLDLRFDRWRLAAVKKRHYWRQRAGLRSRMDWVPVLQQTNTPARADGELPAIVRRGGLAAERAWEDFFAGVIANDLTRIAYRRAVRCSSHGLRSATRNCMRLPQPMWGNTCVDSKAACRKRSNIIPRCDDSSICWLNGIFASSIQRWLRAPNEWKSVRERLLKSRLSSLVDSWLPSIQQPRLAGEIEPLWGS